MPAPSMPVTAFDTLPTSVAATFADFAKAMADDGSVIPNGTRMGYAQRFGAGIPVAGQAIEFNGNPPLEFVVDPSFIGVVLRRAR
jgi:hypothetical protein